MTASRVDNQTIAYSPTSSVRGIRHLAIASGTAAEYTTTSGTDATSVLCSTITDASPTHIGRLVEFLSGDNKGLRAICVANQSGDLTVEEMPNTIASGVRFRILDCPAYVSVADSGGTTNWTDATLTESTNFFKDYYVRPIEATEAITDEMARVTAHNAGTGALTVATFDATVTANDVAILERPILAEDLTHEHPTDMIERNPIRDTNVPEQSIAGARRGGTVSFSLPLKGDNTGAGDSTDAWRWSSVIPLLEACFGTLTLDQGETVQAPGDVDGSTGTPLIVATDPASDDFTSGALCMVNGNAVPIELAATAAAQLTLSGALPDNAQTNDIIYAGANIRYASTGHYPIGCFEIWEDQVRYRYWSCYGTVTFSTDAAGRLMANFSFQAQSWDSLDQSCPVTDVQKAYPDADVEDIIARDTPVSLSATTAEANATQVEVATFSLDPGLVVSARPTTGGIEGSKSFLVTGCKPTFAMNPLKENDTYDTSVVNQTCYQLLAQFGSKPGNTVAFWMPKVQITSNGKEDAEGYMRNTIAGKAVVPASTDPLGEGIVISFL